MNISDFEKIVQYIRKARYQDFSKRIIDKAKIHILDTICVSALGSQIETTNIIKRTILRKNFSVILF